MTDVGIRAGSSAVVADRIPLVRLGLVTSLGLAGVTTVAHAEDVTDGVEAALGAGADLLVLGSTDNIDMAALRRQIDRMGSIRVVVLVARADRAALVSLLEAGADAVALRTIAPEEFGVLVRRVLAGERSVGPALMSVLIELDRNEALPDAPTPSRLPEVGLAAGRVGVALAERTDTRTSRPDAGLPAVVTGLTSRELAVLTRLAHGESNAEIARALFVSRATVKTHLTHIYAKLGVGSRHGAVARAVAIGLLH